MGASFAEVLSHCGRSVTALEDIPVRQEDGESRPNIHTLIEADRLTGQGWAEEGGRRGTSFSEK